MGILSLSRQNGVDTEALTQSQLKTWTRRVKVLFHPSISAVLFQFQEVQPNLQIKVLVLFDNTRDTHRAAAYFHVSYRDHHLVRMLTDT